MENRIVEIARKKAQNLPNKNHQTHRTHKGSDTVFFARADRHTPPIFPPDIMPERRKLSVDMSSALILLEVAPKARVAAAETSSPKKPARKRKATAKKARKPGANANLAKKQGAKTQSTRKPRAKKPTVKAAMVEQQVKLVQPGNAECPPLVDAPTPPNISPPSPTNAFQAQPDTLLPSARAVAVYRKNGILDVLGYWMRQRASDIVKLLKPSPKRVKVPPHIAKILAENVALRKEIDRLRSLQAG